MSKMSELASHQDTLDKINMSKPQRVVHEAAWAVSALVTAPDEELSLEGVTASTLKTMVDLLMWKMCALYAEEQRNKTDGK